MYTKTLVTFFNILLMPLVSANYEPPVNNTVANSVFLQKLRTTKEPEKRINLILSLETKVSESSRLTLESIALDTKEAGEIRMQAICSLGSMTNQKSVPILLDILETDIKQRRGFWACAIPVLASLKDRRAIPLLTRIANLNEEHLAGMDHMAIEALAGIGDEREVSLLDSKAFVVPVRLAVIKGLARIASIQSTDTLIIALQEQEEPEIMKAAEAGLIKINKAAIPALKKTLEETPEGWDKDYHYRIQKLISRIQQQF